MIFEVANAQIQQIADQEEISLFMVSIPKQQNQLYQDLVAQEYIMREVACKYLTCVFTKECYLELGVDYYTLAVEFDNQSLLLILQEPLSQEQMQFLIEVIMTQTVHLPIWEKITIANEHILPPYQLFRNEYIQSPIDLIKKVLESPSEDDEAIKYYQIPSISELYQYPTLTGGLYETPQGFVLETAMNLVDFYPELPEIPIPNHQIVSEVSDMIEEYYQEK